VTKQFFDAMFLILAFGGMVSGIALVIAAVVDSRQRARYRRVARVLDVLNRDHDLRNTPIEACMRADA
jgi:hypothetical protein